MLNKWLHLASGRHPQDAPAGNTNGARGQDKSTLGEAAPANKINTYARGKGFAASQDLLSLEDIYRGAGIMNLRLGYSINTVVEMLNSDHIRGLSNDVKRASVLMALEACRIPVDELLHDATQRLDALNAFEAGQREYVEEYEARKAQENAQIQAEIERITAHCLGLIKHNLDEVASAKDVLRNWQTMKQKEALRISEAVGLFAKQSPSEPPSDLQPALQTVGATDKP